MRHNSRRDLKKESGWRKRLRSQAASGLSVRAWCHKKQLQEATFHWWRREIARRDAESLAVVPRPNAESPAFVSQSKMAATFVPVHITSEAEPVYVTPTAISDGINDPSVHDAVAGRIEIMLASDHCVRVVGRVDRQALVDVLAVLDERDAGTIEQTVSAQGRRVDGKGARRC